MTSQRRGGRRQALLDMYWAIVGLFGIGQPIVDRRAMFGDGPTADPYSLDWAPTPHR